MELEWIRCSETEKVVSTGDYLFCLEVKILFFQVVSFDPFDRLSFPVFGHALALEDQFLIC